MVVRLSCLQSRTKFCLAMEHERPTLPSGDVNGAMEGRPLMEPPRWLIALLKWIRLHYIAGNRTSRVSSCLTGIGIEIYFNKKRKSLRQETGSPV